MTTDELFKAPKLPGIYYFRNKLNGKYYIGQAQDLRRRLRKHVSNFNNNRYDNPIYRAIGKYGWENFEWGILEIFDEGFSKEVDKKLDEAEIKYIKEFNSYGSTGYNQTLGGDGGIKGYKFTEEQRKRTSETLRNKSFYNEANKIYYFNIETNEYGEWPTWVDFRRIHNIKTNQLDVTVHNKIYIVARSKEQLEKKIEYYNTEFKNTKKFSNTKVKQLSVEQIKDIKNGMKQEEYCEKYSVCRKTYYTHKNIVFPNKQRTYETKIDLGIYEIYRKEHTREQTAVHFNISIDLTYRYDKRLKDFGNALRKIDSTSSKITEEMKRDILNGIPLKDYCQKYNVSEALYCNHVRIIKESEEK